MSTKETLLDIYADGGDWDDFEPIIDEMISRTAVLEAMLREARELLEPIAKRDASLILPFETGEVAHFIRIKDISRASELVKKIKEIVNEHKEH